MSGSWSGDRRPQSPERGNECSPGPGEWVWSPVLALTFSAHLKESLCFLSFLICTMEMVIPSWIIMKIKWFNKYEAPSTVIDSNNWQLL